MSEQMVAYIDGGSRGNPGPAGYGVRIETASGELLDEFFEFIGNATNNVAEYRGLIAALDYFRENSHLDVVIRSDSQLLTRQMTGRYQVRHPKLKTLSERAKKIALNLHHVKYEHIPRVENEKADALANAAMDECATEKTAPSNSAEPVDQLNPSQRSAISLVEGSQGHQILGIGIDLEEVSRVDRLVRCYGNRFLNRVFTEHELNFSHQRRFPAQHLAGRFSAKEAAMKALGTGHMHGVSWRHIEIVRHSGPPELQLHGGAQHRFEILGATRALVTITHTRELAMAQVALIK